MREEWILSQWLSSFFRWNIGWAGGSNQRPPVLKSGTLQTELWGSVLIFSEFGQYIHCDWTDWLILWCLTAFTTVFQLYRGGQCTYPSIPGKNIGQAGDRTTDHLFLSLVRYRLRYGARLWSDRPETKYIMHNGACAPTVDETFLSMITSTHYNFVP